MRIAATATFHALPVRLPSPDTSHATQSPGDDRPASVREGAANPGAPAAGAHGGTAPGPQQQRAEQLLIAELASRDQEVRAHEQAHAAVGGSHAGAPSYTYSRGPDGKRYAVGGEVSIDVAAVPNDPEATLAKMEIVVRAALAPAEPSAQDLRVAAQAQAQMVEARAELARIRSEQPAATQAQRSETSATDDATQSALPAPVSSPDLDLYRRLAGPAAAAGAQVDLIA